MRTLALSSALLLFSIATPAAARRVCPGDCSGDGRVTVDEVLIGVNIALLGGFECPSFDSNEDGGVTVDEVVRPIQFALHGCPIETQADAAFWQTLLGDAQREEESLQLFARAIASNPTDSRSHFLLGMMHMYRYGKSLTGFQEFSDFAKAEIQLAQEALDTATALNPEHRSYPGFRGAATYQAGVTLDDPELEALGVQQLQDAIEVWPLFNRFSFLGTIAAVVPASDPLFIESFDHLTDLLANSLGECTPELCANDGRAPRNLEGSGLLFGDIFAKGGDLASARGWYQLSAGAGAATAWEFAELAQERLATVEQRVALYQDDDPSNDPPLVGLADESCAVCHQR